MNKIVIASMIVASVMASLAGCGSKPVQPEWKASAAGSLKSFSQFYLKGDTGAAESEFKRARIDMASTGRPDLVAHAELYRCATRVASLEYDHCPGFEALAQDATAAERAYAAYLAGNWQNLNAALLPEQHRAIVQGKGGIAAIADPLSQLVAAGVLMKTAAISPADIKIATETASGQGWRRPLLMWLGVAHKRAGEAGDLAEAARIQRRIDLALPAK